MKGGVQLFQTRDVRNVIHCSIGGILSIYPILMQAEQFVTHSYNYTQSKDSSVSSSPSKKQQSKNNNNISNIMSPHKHQTSSNLVALFFELISQLLHFSASNQLSMQRAHGFAILAYLLSQLPGTLSTCV